MSDAKIMKTLNGYAVYDEAAHREIETLKGAAPGLVFDTAPDMEAYVAEHSAELRIGQDLYIRQADVPDYWWDGTQAIPVETDMTEIRKEMESLSEAIAELEGKIPTEAGGLTAAQISALGRMFEIAAYTMDAMDAYAAFKEVFGINEILVPATAIILSATSLSFTEMTPQTVEVDVSPADTTDNVVWTTTDSNVAIVDNGVVTPVANGNCNITATAGSVSAVCTVAVEITVEEPDTGATLTSISATYSGGKVGVGTALTDLTGIIVTATYSDGSTVNVTDYTLSGEIDEGENTITVSYGGQTATFTVTGGASTFEEVLSLAADDVIFRTLSTVPGEEYPYTDTTKYRLSYPAFIPVSGGETYKFDFEATTPNIIFTLEFYNSRVTENVANGVSFSNSDRQSMGWKTPNTSGSVYTVPDTFNNLPVESMRITFKDSVSEYTIKAGQVTSLVISKKVVV